MPHAHLLNGAQLVERLALEALHQQGSQGIAPQIIGSHLPQMLCIALYTLSLPPPSSCD